ncbi:MAG TPA: hypothetical protein VGN31_14715, partial [Paraburkholderia sp.]
GLISGVISRLRTRFVTRVLAGLLPAARVSTSFRAAFATLRVPRFAALRPPRLLTPARIAVPRVLLRAAGLARRRIAGRVTRWCGSGLTATGLAALLTRRAATAFAVFPRSMRRAIRGFFR